MPIAGNRSTPITEILDGEPLEAKGHLKSSDAEVLTATGSDAALDGGFASPPVAQPAPYGVTETVEALIAAG